MDPSLTCDETAFFSCEYFPKSDWSATLPIAGRMSRVPLGMDCAILSIRLTSPASSSSSLSTHVTYLLDFQSTRDSVSAGSWQYKGEWKMSLWSKGRRKYRKKMVVTAIIIVVAMCFGSAKERGLLPGEIQLLFHGGGWKAWLQGLYIPPSWLLAWPGMPSSFFSPI